MKKMLMAATIVGSAIAGIILYVKKQRGRGRLLSPKNTRKTIGEGSAKMERPGQHAMG